MNKQNLLNEINKASFNVNKRFQKPDHFPSNESVLKTVHSLMDQGQYEVAIDLIEEHRQKSSDAVKEYPKLLIAEGVSLIALSRIEQALIVLNEANAEYEKRLEGDSDNEAWRRNVSSVQTNIATCQILQNDYKSAVKSALSARKWCCKWHGPHINLITSYLRMNDTNTLDHVIEEMVNTWPEWNSNEAMISHLHGNNDQIPDTDLIGIVEKLASLGHSVKPENGEVENEFL